MAIVTPTDRPKSVRNHCVIEVFGGVFVLSIGFRIFCWYRGFCHRTESYLILFICISVHTKSYNKENIVVGDVHVLFPGPWTNESTKVKEREANYIAEHIHSRLGWRRRLPAESRSAIG